MVPRNSPITIITSHYSRGITWFVLPCIAMYYYSMHYSLLLCITTTVCITIYYYIPPRHCPKLSPHSNFK